MAFEPARKILTVIAGTLDIKTPKVPVFMGTSGQAETDPARIRELLAGQTIACERHLDAVRAAFKAGCRTFVETSFKPQPVTWLSDQLEAGTYKGVPVTTAELAL